MSTINNSFGNMFGSNQNSSSSVSFLFGNQSNALGDLALIRSGSYKKLLKSYYNTQKEDSQDGSTTTETKRKNTSSGVKDLLKNQVSSKPKMKKKENDKTTAVSADVANAYAAVKTNATSLQAAATKLRDTGSLYRAKTDKDGKQSVDKDAIVSVVKDYVKAYNDTLDATAKVDGATITRNTKYMVSTTNTNKNVLADMGITIGEDNKLTLNEDKFKQADIEKIKDAFVGKNSYMDMVAYRARYSANLASSGAYQNVSASSYTNNGTYATTGTYNSFNYYY